MSENDMIFVDRDDSDSEDIDPSGLIDTRENKPKVNNQEETNFSEEEKKGTNYKKLERKQVSKLTEDEKAYLIDLYKNGGEDDYYKVYFYKNGTNKIVKKKQPPKYNTAKRLLEQQNGRPVMTTEQVLMEHVIDLETKYATLYQKHKKLKKNYKSLHEDIYYDDEDDGKITIPSKSTTSTPEPVAEPEPIKEVVDEQPKMETNSYPSNYINRLRKPQKGYRGMMANRF